MGIESAESQSITIKINEETPIKKSGKVRPRKIIIGLSILAYVSCRGTSWYFS